jgi:hypothetical protein
MADLAPMLPDIRGMSIGDLENIELPVLRALCVACGAPSICTFARSRKKTMVAWLHENATRSDAPWPEQLAAFMQKQRGAWTSYFVSQGVAHGALQAARARIRADAANVATAAASAAAAAAAAADEIDASVADTFFGADASGGALTFLLANFLARQETDAEYGDLLTRIEVEGGDLAGIALPRSAKEQVEEALCFMANTPNAAGFADAVATAQLQSWFPAYVECLLDPSWQIPGFSPWWSARIREFLRVRFFLFLS